LRQHIIEMAWTAYGMARSRATAVTLSVRRPVRPYRYQVVPPDEAETRDAA